MARRIALVVSLAVACITLATLIAASVALARSGETDIEEAGATRISVSGDWLAAGASSVWITDPPANVIRQLDPGSGKTRATIRVLEGPCEASDVGYGAFWTATCGTPGLARINPVSHRVSGFVHLAIPQTVDGEGSVGAGAGGIWLVVDGPTCSACRVARVSPRSLRVTARISVKAYAAAVRVGFGAVWVTNPQENVVQKIDPRTNRVVATTRVGPGPRFLEVGEGGVWALNQGNGSVSRLDPKTAKVVATIATGATGEGGDMTVGGGWAWARGSRALLTRIDPRTNKVAETYGPSSGSGAATVGGGAVWASAHDITTVWRLPSPRR